MGAAWSKVSEAALRIDGTFEEEVAADVPAPEDTADAPAPKDTAQEPALAEASEPCATSQTLCCVCGTPCSQRCSRCKKQTYCGEAHMEQDWPMHRQNCFVAGEQGTLKAILFHMHEDEPRLVKIPYIISEFGIMQLHDSPWFFHSPRLEMQTISKHIVNNIPASKNYNLIVLYANDALLPDGPANRCVQQAAGGRCTHPFGNNFLVLRADKWRGPWVLKNVYRSARMEDVPAVVEDFVEWSEQISRARTAYSRACNEAIAIFSGPVKSCMMNYVGSVSVISRMPEPTTAADRRSTREAYQSYFAWLTRPRDNQELLVLSEAQCTCDLGESLVSSHQAGLEVMERLGRSFYEAFFLVAEHILGLFCTRLDANPRVEGQETRQRVHRMLHRRNWPGTWQEMLPHGPKDTIFALLSLLDINPSITLRYSTMTAIAMIVRHCHPLVIPVLVSSPGTVVSGIVESIHECQEAFTEQTRSNTPDVEDLALIQRCLASTADLVAGMFMFSHETQRTIFNKEGGGYLLDAYSGAILLCQALAEKNRFSLSESVIAQNSHVSLQFEVLGGWLYDDCPNSRKKGIEAGLVELFDKCSNRRMTPRTYTWARLLGLFDYLEARQQCAAPSCTRTFVDGPLWRCAGCLRVVYCSRACQKRAWGHAVAHRTVCGVLAQLQTDLQIPSQDSSPSAFEEGRTLPRSDAWLPLANTALDHFVRLIEHNIESTLETTDRPSPHPKTQPQARTQAQPRPQPQVELQAQPPYRSCQICEKPGKRQCRGCTEMHYCGKSHAKKDWPQHMKVCGRPRGTVDAIFFPTDADTPRIVQLEYTMEYEEEDGVEWMRLHDDRWFVPRRTVRERVVQAGNHDLIIRYSDDFLVDGSPVNRCIRHLLRGRKCTHPWGNGILAVRADPRMPMFGGDPHYRSAHISDVAAVVEEFVVWDHAYQRYGIENAHRTPEEEMKAFMSRFLG